MGNPFQNIRNKIYADKDKGKPITTEDLPEIHIYLMRYFNCWIPLEEFKRMPIPTLWILLDTVNNQNKKK